MGRPPLYLDALRHLAETDGPRVSMSRLNKLGMSRYLVHHYTTSGYLVHINFAEYWITDSPVIDIPTLKAVTTASRGVEFSFYGNTALYFHGMCFERPVRMDIRTTERSSKDTWLRPRLLQHRCKVRRVPRKLFTFEVRNGIPVSDPFQAIWEVRDTVSDVELRALFRQGTALFHRELPTSSWFFLKDYLQGLEEVL